MKNITNNFDIVILSPHLDDAALSCGQHIIKWKQEGKKIMIITLFTKHTGYKYLPKYTKEYLKTSGFDTGDDFGAARIIEDIKAMKSLMVKWDHWGLLDAGFRIDKNNKAKYPTRKKLLSAKIRKDDKKLIEKINNKLKKIKSNLYLIPFDIGSHVDHLIVKKAGEKIEGNKLYYLESPYLWQRKNFFTGLKMLKKIKSFKFGKKEKNQVLQKYTSQYHLQVNRHFIYPEILVG